MVVLLLTGATPGLSRIAVWSGTRYNPRGSTVDAGLDAAARARRAERAANGGVVHVQHALPISRRAPPISAQRVARFYQTPPDLVVKCQLIDIVDVIL